MQYSEHQIQRDQSVENTFRTERARLLDFIRSRVRTDEDAEDILQDIFYRLLTGYNVLEPIENLTAWLFRTARNRIIDWYRKRRPETLPDVPDESSSLGVVDLLLDRTNGPDERYTRELLWDAIEEALDELPEEQRDVFVMNELEGKSFREISEITGININTLLARKRYAVLSLREKLQLMYDEFEHD
ncbi:MAG TPA: RNA polymerase sigma factor [Bacteroidota bacterium]|nr:RNA polymerase sigma factor [Bacteroidota bacterium]